MQFHQFSNLFLVHPKKFCCIISSNQPSIIIPKPHKSDLLTISLRWGIIVRKRGQLTPPSVDFPVLTLSGLTPSAEVPISCAAAPIAFCLLAEDCATEDDAKVAGAANGGGAGGGVYDGGEAPKPIDITTQKCKTRGAF